MRCAAVFIVWLVLCGAAWAAADEDWQALIALDAGPQRKPANAVEAQTITLNHVAQQEKALRGFVAAHPADPRSFEARLRLARLLALRVDLQGGEGVSKEAQQILTELEKTASPEQRVEVEFARISQTMRAMRKPTAQQRDALLGRVRRFQAAHPTDVRLGALLAEVSTLFDSQPKTKQQLLLQAREIARDEDLLQRIADDLRRVEMLGQPVPLRFKKPDGRMADVAEYRGKIVVLIFFAVWSPPSTEALQALQRATASLPRERVQIVGVSLDTKRERLTSYLESKSISWPVFCDLKGWESPAIRELAINALPTVWLLDGQGRLRSLNALDGTVGQVRQLMAER